jgi:CheY-like chemotaxis protein
MHRTYLADIERGARNVTLRSIVNLAMALQVTVGNLMAYATSPGSSIPILGDKSPSRAAGEILLVEDNALDAALTERAFKRARFTNPLRIIRDGEEALDYLHGAGTYAKRGGSRPQLILLDLNLPGMSGLELLRRLKGDKRTRDIPVVVLTMTQSDIIVIECCRLGAKNYIVKPIGIESLVKITPKLNMHLTLGTPVPRGSMSGFPRDSA